MAVQPSLPGSRTVVVVVVVLVVVALVGALNIEPTALRVLAVVSVVVVSYRRRPFAVIEAWILAMIS